MDDKRLRALLTAVQCGSFGKATAQLGYTQSAMTHMVNKLEAELGCTLLARSSHGVRLSEEGEHLLPYIQDYLRASETLRREAAAQGEAHNRVLRIGCGMGKKDFEAANCVRALLGEQAEDAVGGPCGPDGRVAELCCNLDDMTPEAIGFAMERLFEAGALDVYTTPIGMKKNRPGVLLTCLSAPENRERVLKALFLHTTTLGVREALLGRYTLKRGIASVETPDGPVRVKRASGYGAEREKVEFDDAARIAAQTGESLAAVTARLLAAAHR